MKALPCSTPPPRHTQVTEKFNLRSPCKVMRRDLRRGQATAVAARTDDRRGVSIDVSFGAPFPGKLL
eukprot:69144-Chlamydomonas_euryale.AAC.1